MRQAQEDQVGSLVVGMTCRAIAATRFTLEGHATHLREPAQGGAYGQFKFPALPALSRWILVVFALVIFGGSLFWLNREGV